MELEIEGLKCEAKPASSQYSKGCVQITHEGMTLGVDTDLRSAIQEAKRALRDAGYRRPAAPKNDD